MLCMTATTVFGAKLQPYGCGVVTPNDDPNLSTETCWTNPYCNFVLIRTRGSTIWTGDNTYNWAYFDSAVSLAQQSGKLLMLQVNFGTSGAPSWLYTEGVTQWTCTNPGQAGTMPAPWDTTFQAKFTTFIQALAARYNPSPYVTGIDAWVGGVVPECFFAQTAADVAALNLLGGASTWLNAAEALLKIYTTNFYGTPIFIMTGIPYPDSNATMTTLAEFADTNWVGLQTNALSPSYPSSNLFPHTNVSVSNLNVWPGSQLLNPSQPVSGCVTNAENRSITFIQFYPGDLESDPTDAAAYNAFVTHEIFP